MTNLKQRLILLQTVFLLLQPFTLSSNISCSAGVVTIGGQARITCFFDRDIKLSKLNFVIGRFPLNETKFEDKTNVLSCNWLAGGGLNCRPTKGYEFNRQTVTTTVSVDIPTATADQEGIYKCQLQIQEIIPTSNCNLTVQAREENQPIDNLFTALTPTGAFVLIVVLIVVCVFLIIAFIIYCRKNMGKRRREQTAKRETRTVDRGTNTNPVAAVECVSIAVNTDDSADFASKGNPLTRLFKKEDKKTASTKQPAPKRSQENLTEEQDEGKPLLSATAPPQYGPHMTQMKGSDADHSPDVGQPTQEAAGGADVAEVGDTAGVEIQMASGNTDDTAQDNTETDQYTAQNDNGKSKEKGKGRKGISLFKKK